MSEQTNELQGAESQSHVARVVGSAPLTSEQQGAESQCPVVAVSVVGSAPLLWRMRDLQAARGQGLVGALVGALARGPRQNGRMGRPLRLLHEEQRLLGERHAIATATRTQVSEDRADKGKRRKK